MVGESIDLETDIHVSENIFLAASHTSFSVVFAWVVRGVGRLSSLSGTHVGASARHHITSVVLQAAQWFGIGSARVGKLRSHG
jgi:hypothetical protein